MLTVIKRNGKKEAFNEQKIINAILFAGLASGDEIDFDFCKKVVKTVTAHCINNELTIEQIQEIVESSLMKSSYEAAAKKYIIYRDRRDKDRRKDSKQVKTFNEIIEIADNDVNKENANINMNTPAGMMMKFASETAKEYALEYLINPIHAQAHRDGHIHIHDLDYYPTGSTTCSQIDLIAVLKNGFSTNDGPVREPKTIRSAAALAAIVLQSSQNEQHGKLYCRV